MNCCAQSMALCRSSSVHLYLCAFILYYLFYFLILFILLIFFYLLFYLLLYFIYQFYFIYIYLWCLYDLIIMPPTLCPPKRTSHHERCQPRKRPSSRASPSRGHPRAPLSLGVSQQRPRFWKNSILPFAIFKKKLPIKSDLLAILLPKVLVIPT